MIEKYSKIIVDVILKKDELKPIDWDSIDFVKLLVQASHNRLLYRFASNLLDSGIDMPDEHREILMDVVKEGEKSLGVATKTINIIDDVLKKENLDYLIVKTFKYLDYVTFDMDFLVRYEDFEKVIEAFKKHDVKVTPHPNPQSQGLHQKNCFRKGTLTMDLHRKFFWLGVDHIDLEYVWGAPTKREMYGVNCLVPNLETDFLLHNKQLVNERGYITLLDFLAVKYANDEGLDWEAIVEQIFKYKWDGAFFVLMGWLNYMHREIFGEDMVDVSKHFKKKHRVMSKKELKLPLIYPVWDVMNVFKEIAFKQKHIPYFEFAYYFFAMGRYLIKNRFPFYDHWYNFNKLGRGKYITANCIH